MRARGRRETRQRILLFRLLQRSGLPMDLVLGERIKRMGFILAERSALTIFG